MHLQKQRLIPVSGMNIVSIGVRYDSDISASCRVQLIDGLTGFLHGSATDVAETLARFMRIAVKADGDPVTGILDVEHERRHGFGRCPPVGRILFKKDAVDVEANGASDKMESMDALTLENTANRKCEKTRNGFLAFGMLSSCSS